IPLLADGEIRASRSAVASDNAGAALDHALTARTLEPWAASPYLQLALVTERAGELRAARSWIDGAILRSPDDWRPWLVLARIDARAGHVKAARSALHHAARLSPRSPLFQNLARTG